MRRYNCNCKSKQKLIFLVLSAVFNVEIFSPILPINNKSHVCAISKYENKFRQADLLIF